MRLFLSRPLFCTVFILLQIVAADQAALGQLVQWRVEDGGNGHYYEQISPNGGISWSQSKTVSEASMLGGVAGHLATITSQEEWGFVTQNFSGTSTWIGLTDESQEGEYRWVTGEPFEFSAWGTGPQEPNNLGDEDYVFFAERSTTGWGWNDFDDAASAGVVNVVQLSYLVEFSDVGDIDILVSTGSDWSYLDNGSNQGTDWFDSEFDDSTWDSEPAQLGYGDGDEATVVNCGPDAPDCDTGNFATTYFRRTFEVDDADRVESLTALLLRDDAAAVYLNGIEVFRDSNLPANATFNTFATSGGDENGETTFGIEPVLLLDGENVLAVEVHQTSATSSDISFDLSLTATIDPVPEPNTLTLAALGLVALVARGRRRRAR